MITHKDDHLQEALDKLAQQFKEKPNLASLIGCFVGSVQDLENVLFEIFDETRLDAAFGVQLDGLGTIVGEQREGRLDNAYRTAIKGRIYLNKMSGTPEELIQMTLFLTGPNNVQIVEEYPASFDLYIDNPLTPDPAQWQPLTAYALGTLASNEGKAYVVTIAGTSAAAPGPEGTGSGIVDGTVTWNYSGPGIGERIATLVLSGKPAGVRGIVHWQEVGLDPFGFFDDPSAFGFDVGHFVQAIDG